MSDKLYNPLKLSEYREKFIGIRVCIIGAGAVGTYLMEYFAKMGLSPDVIDFDSFTIENAAKHSCLVRTPDDAGRNKAQCVAERVKPLLDEGCTSNGIDSDICNFGPEAFADYMYVILAVDNYAAKALFDELIKQLPEERRPKVIMCGTYDEKAESVILDHKEFCIRCLMDESWLENGMERHSCVGPMIRRINGSNEIIRTSNLASSMAAHLCAEQLRADIIGLPDVMNRRISYTAYPSLGLATSYPIVKKDCPGCSVRPPKEINWLSGSVLNVTLKDMFEQLEQKTGCSDLEIQVHMLNYNNTSYSKFYLRGVCGCCGKVIALMKHEGRLSEESLVCPECSSKGLNAHSSRFSSEGEGINAFTKDNSKEMMNMTLYELGYPLGAHISVLNRNGAFDCFDSDKMITMTFAFSEDHTQIHNITKL